jgi:hypothetical protein
VQLLEGKEMKIRHILLLLVVVVSSFAIGCTPRQSNTGYLGRGGRGEVRGELNGVAFCALIEVGEGGAWGRVEYLAPASLCGLVLEVTGERCEVFLGEVKYTCDAREVAAFLQPVSVFLMENAHTATQREGENTVLTFPTGEVLTLSKNGQPLSFSGEQINLHVVWWQSGERGAGNP